MLCYAMPALYNIGSHLPFDSMQYIRGRHDSYTKPSYALMPDLVSNFVAMARGSVGAEFV